MFDYIFITHLPSFYKINLYNKLSKKLKICVIFVGNKSNIRTDDFTAGNINFEYYFLSDKEFENRNIIKCLFRLYFLLKKTKFRKLVVGGWDLLEFWFAIFLTKSNKNSLALESTIEESGHSGIKKIIKKIFLWKVDIVFASGSRHKALLNTLNYKKKVFVTNGVGIINKQNNYSRKNPKFGKSFLYVGRLSDEKNLFMLIKIFNEMKQFKLNIVGSGHLEQKLKKEALQNISFLHHVDNNEIFKIYLKNDCLILPSKRETWGLVVEEALYFGLPVIISNKVGCGPELIEDNLNGIIFDVLSIEDLKKSIMTMSENYTHYYNEVMRFNLEQKDNYQIERYITALKN